ELVQLDHLASRPAPLLSGGQQQRVALARAIATEPKLLLLDEPLSNLDAKLREEMRHEIKEMVKQLNITTLYVTHDQVEALSMSDRLAIMSGGRILQMGSPAEVYLHPNSEFTANFLGKANVLPARISGGVSGGLWDVETPCGTLRCPATDWAAAGKHGLVIFRPEGLEVLAHEAAGPNVIRGTVREASFIGEVVEYGIEIEGRSARLRAKGDPYGAVEEGASVWLRLPPQRCLLIPADGLAAAEPVPAMAGV
ncbi:MAG: ABC transporter ATP-binding protein, partial [Chloroflexota bacterium]